MLARICPGLLVVATLGSALLAACSSDSDDAAEVNTGDPSTSSANTESTSGQTQGSGGSSGATSTTSATGATSASDAAAGGTETGGSDTNANDSTTASGGSGGATTGGATTGAAGSSGAGGATAELPYAHVVAVVASGAAGAYTFNVSVESSDIDCSQFADWWEVVSEDGALLYRRILEHSHTDENGTSDADAPGNTFTRSGGPVDISADQVVIVRAHMSNLDEYNGVAMRGSVALGFEAAKDLDPAFAAELESAAPQPGDCLF